MEKTKQLEETIKNFKQYTKDVQKATLLEEVDRAEKAAVSALQLMQLQVVQAGDDLYKLAKTQRYHIRKEALNEKVLAITGRTVEEVDKMAIATPTVADIKEDCDNIEKRPKKTPKKTTTKRAKK